VAVIEWQLKINPWLIIYVPRTKMQLQQRPKDLKHEERTITFN